MIFTNCVPNATYRTQRFAYRKSTPSANIKEENQHKKATPTKLI